MYISIEEHPETTYFNEFFLPCKTIELESLSGEKRTFVSYISVVDYEEDKRYYDAVEQIPIINIIRQLLKEKDNSFFFHKDSDAQGPFLVGKKEYWLKYLDITQRWPNHLYLRTKEPIIGFKTVNHDGSPVLGDNDSGPYFVGETYTKDEKEMLEKTGNGFFFSPSISKALFYKKNASNKVFLVVAWGLIFIKNKWCDLCASNLSVIKELSSKEIKMFSPSIKLPKFPVELPLNMNDGENY